MKQTLQKIINKCGCIDIKVVVLLFFLLIIIMATYNGSVKDEDCNCGD